MRCRISSTCLVLACLALAPQLSAASPISAQQLVGGWYNVDYGMYPGFAVLSLTGDGQASITGLDGRRRSGDYELRADGRLVIRMRQDAAPFAHKVIIDSVPVLDGERLQLQARQRTFFLSQAPWLKAEVERATARYQKSQARRSPRKWPAAKPGAGSARPTTPPASPVPAIKRLLVRQSGAGAAAEGCAAPVLNSLRREGWKIVNRAADADAIVEIELSAIRQESSVWVGSYYKINYRIKLKQAANGRLLGSMDGAERATGDGRFEVCIDVANDIAGEVEDLVEDAWDD